jgi:hypothetical protein
MSYGQPTPPPYAVHTYPPGGVVYASPGSAVYATPVGAPYGVPMQSDANIVKDYLVWSIINIFCGWGIAGLIPLVFSLLCRNNKSMNNYSGARSMSTLALVSNIIITIGGLIGWITFIAVMAVFLSAGNYR